MNRENAKELAKAQLEVYLRSQGINTRKAFRCLNPAHGDKNPSMSYDKTRKRVHCFSCGVGYDIFDLIGIKYGLSDNRDKFVKTFKLFGINIDQANQRRQSMPTQSLNEQKKEQCVIEYIRQVQDKIKDTSYPQERGLSAAVIERFGLGFDNNFKVSNGPAWQALIIPTGADSYTARNIDKRAEGDNKIRKHGKNRLFNIDAFKNDQPVFVCEGEFDAMSFYEIEVEAIALGSTANWRQLIEYLKSNRPAYPVLLSLDQDETGKKITAKLASELKSLGIPFYLPDVYGQYKDANEALVADKEAFKERAKQALNSAIEERNINVNTEVELAEETARQQYLKNNVANCLTKFREDINRSAHKRFIPTGFKQLDNILDGGLFDGLYIIGAISSLGKTTLIIQVADHIATCGQDVLYISLEMSRYEIIAKSISRHTLLHCTENGKNSKNAKTIRGITVGNRYASYSTEELEVIFLSSKAYEKYASKLYIIEGLGDIGVEQIRKTVEEHKRYIGNTPVVIVDYLQILSPYNVRATDKQNTDKSVLDLKRISRDFETPVIAISSLNRQSYKDSITMEAFKESGAIEYSSDVLIGLQLKGSGSKDFDADYAKCRNPREVELKILKNRNGATGGVVNFEYYPHFNYFSELKAKI